MSMTRGIEILNTIPSNEAELISAISISNEYFSWKNWTVDGWISNFIFDKKRRNPEALFVHEHDKEYYYVKFLYIIPKNVIKDMAKAINAKDLETYGDCDSWEEYFEDYESSTLEYLAQWLIKMLDTMTESQCFCYYNYGN